jgi:ATP-dependent DNA helicase RecG
MSSAGEKQVLAVLGRPLAQLRAVGDRLLPQFHRLELHNVLDLLFYFPRDYEDLTDLRPLNQLQSGSLQSAVGTVTEVEASGGSFGRRHVLGVLIEGDGGYLRLVWFNQPFMQKKFHAGQRLLVSGKAVLKGRAWEMTHPKVQWLAAEETNIEGRILPLYSLTEGLSQHHVRRAVQEALGISAPLLEEAFPEIFLAAHQIMPIAPAIENIHFPADQARLTEARRRFVYQELYILQLALALRRQQQRVMSRSPQLEITPKIDARIRRLIPFKLTPDQEAAIRDLVADLARPYPMNRLLQGDVGTGKTVIAVYAVLLAIAAGSQAVLMAPTEVLARQHAATLDHLLHESRVRRTLLTGGMPAADKSRVLAAIAAGEIDLVIGTQAILQNDVEFPRLGLVVIDEQHKFGVRQRARLKSAGADPHYLVMTATPIPRTITMTLFGDLDVSTLKTAPPGRQAVRTYLPAADRRASWWEFFREKLREGRQGYVIAPLVEESEEIEAASVQETFETLINGELADFRVGLAHGRLSPAEKQQVMESFRRGDLQVLVSTTVIEVGVDVPNATLMTIEGGERFGLSQLHQLRGRVSRGLFPGQCCVFADPQTDESRRRLEAFAKTTDGFELAELDLAIRGPGDLFGSRQHGLPPLWIADLLRDAAVLDEARRAATETVAADPGLAQPQHARLRRMMLVRYGQSLELGDVG